MNVARECFPQPAAAGLPATLAEKLDPVCSWQVAHEELGEFIGLRFGQVLPAKSSPDWTYLRSTDYDGIGGLAAILRNRGAPVSHLPQLQHPARPSVGRLLWAWGRSTVSRRRVGWASVEGKPGHSSSAHPPLAAAWHGFDEETTLSIRQTCRRQGITLSAFLLKHLARAVRPFLQDQSKPLPWRVTVNLRGQLERHSDLANTSSHVLLPVQSFHTPVQVHKELYGALARAEHWANWYARHSGKFIGMGLKKALIGTDLAVPCAGIFSNLGDWDPEKQITSPSCSGPWLFCPPVVRSRPVGAGVVTFQNRLALALQVHPELTSSSNTLWVWIESWVREILFDVTAFLPVRAEPNR
jgi:hypothetical protein